MPGQALVLSTLHFDMTDSSGNSYPKEGYVRSVNYKPDRNILHGLYGILWGVSDNSLYLLDAPNIVWVVTKIDESTQLVNVDQFNNVVKFEYGYVVYSGDHVGASKYIKSYLQEHNEDSISEEFIIGHIEQVVTKKHIFAQSYFSKIFTSEEGTHAIALAEKNDVTTMGRCSHAIALKNDSKTRTCGTECVSMTSGKNSQALSSGSDSISICLGEDSVGAVGENGILIMAYNDGNRKKIAVGYVGHNIEQNIKYKCVEGNFVEFHCHK